MRGLERSQSTVATSMLFLHATKVVHFELLEMEKRDWPDALTTSELEILELPQEILSWIDGRLMGRRFASLVMSMEGRTGED